MTHFESNTYFPRTSGNSFWRPLAAQRKTNLDDLSKIDIDLRRAEFHSQGERRVTGEELLAWRAELNDWAYDLGFPNDMNSAQKSNWDVELGTKLLDSLHGQPEYLHPDVLCWIAVNLLPHFVVYRWGWPTVMGNGEPPIGREKWNRFGTDHKNGLRLAMHRVMTYGPDIARRANQEEFQSIQYRTAFSLDRRVARAILSAIVDGLDDPKSNYGKNDNGQPGDRREDANLIGIELRFINSMRPLCFASDEDIREIVNDTISRLPDLRVRGTEALDIEVDD